MNKQPFWRITALTAILVLASHVSAQQLPGPIQITKGGTYSGTWESTDPKVPAVSIQTDQPVTIRDSVIKSRGPLITVRWVKAGTNVTIENVTGTALDPGIAGMERGIFLLATNVSSLVVRHCSMYGVNTGILVVGSTPRTLKILNNLGRDLEDRASDGKGGLADARPRLGHFIILNNVTASNGADIAWNEDIQTIGTTSNEDAINIYESQGSKYHPINVHDNYIEGSSAPVAPGKHYTGTALITDGSSDPHAKQSAYVRFDDNQVVATAGSGIGIAFGHDISAANNRIVSCGVTVSGLHYGWGASAIVIWNYYKDPEFRHNTITGTTGGMVGQGPHDKLKANDVWQPESKRDADNDNRIVSNTFSDPCLMDGKLNLDAEARERGYWASKLRAAHQSVGDQH